jgi:hypothetical protein
MGTPAFMPPEQAMAHWDQVDARADVFSCAATAYTLLSGALIHDARTAAEALVLAATRQVAPIRTRVPELPAPIAAVLDRGLALRKEDRWRDATAMRAALRRALTESNLTLPPVESLLSWVREPRPDAPSTPSFEGDTTRPRGVTETSASPTLVAHPPASIAVSVKTPPRRRVGLAAGAALLSTGLVALGVTLATRAPERGAEEEPSATTRPDSPPATAATTTAPAPPEAPTVSSRGADDPGPAPSAAVSTSATARPVRIPASTPRQPDEVLNQFGRRKQRRARD